MNLKKIILILIAIIIITPVATQIIGKGNIYGINENRNRLDFPTIEEIKSEGFPVINDWYNDNFGLRDVLIRVQHQADYSLFRFSKTLYFSNINGEEYLHFRSVIANEQIANEKATNEKRRSIVSTFVNIKTVLENQGVDFKFIIPPQKNEILVQANSQMPVNRPDKNMYYEMQEIFEKGDLAQNYVNIIDPLIEWNNVAPVFYKTDFHWNDWGAAVAFGEVINSYSNELGMGEVYFLDNLEYSTFTPGYNDAQLASLSVLKYDIPEEITVGLQLDSFSQEVTDEKYPNYVIWENTKSPKFDKAVLFIGDSYTPPALYAFNGTHNGIVELFPKVYFCHWDYAKGALQNLPNDVGLVVVEAIESNYFYLDDKVKVLIESK